MFIRAGYETARLADRIIAGLIGGTCGFIFGGLVQALADKLFGSGFHLGWIIAFGFALFGFFAPAKSTELWSEFWQGLLGFFAGRHR